MQHTFNSTQKRLSTTPRVTPPRFTLSPTKPPPPPDPTINTIPISSPNICWWTPLNDHHNGYYRVRSYIPTIYQNFGLTNITRMWENVNHISCICDQGFFQFDKDRFEYAQFLTDEKYVMRKIVAHTFVESGVRCGPWRRKGEMYDINGEDQLKQWENVVSTTRVYYFGEMWESINGYAEHDEHEMNELLRSEANTKIYTFGGALGNDKMYAFRC